MCVPVWGREGGGGKRGREGEREGGGGGAREFVHVLHFYSQTGS